MDNLSDMYYLIQLIVRQILIFLRVGSLPPGSNPLVIEKVLTVIFLSYYYLDRRCCIFVDNDRVSVSYANCYFSLCARLTLAQFYVLQNFVFREFTWFTPAEEDLDNAGSKIRTVAPQHPFADLLVFLAICGLLFAFMILSTNSPKNETSNYNTSNIEM